MSARPISLTPQARLARNRAAFADALGGPRHPLPNDAPSEPADPTVSAAPSDAPPPAPSPTWALLQKGLRAWWQAHPARVAVQVAEPAFRDIARERPWSLLGVAAGLGAVLVLTKPWRLLTAGAVTAVALRPVSLPSLLVGVLATLADAPPTAADTCRHSGGAAPD